MLPYLITFYSLEGANILFIHRNGTNIILKCTTNEIKLFPIDYSNIVPSIPT